MMPRASADVGATPQRDTAVAAVMTAVFFCVVAIGMWHHEMWRDEWQAWMIARDSDSISQLLSLVWHEGHMPTWHLLLFALSRFTRDPVAMQLLHLALATASVYLLARFAPLHWATKALTAFSYFLVYEYAVIARFYVLGVLALFVFCALFPRRREHPIAIGAALLLLAITSVFGLVIAAAAVGMLLLESATAAPTGEEVPAGAQGGHPSVRGRLLARVGFGVWVALVALAVAYAVIWPGEPIEGLSRVSDDPMSRWALATTASLLSHGYLPIPDLGEPHFWTSSTWSRGSRLGLVVSFSVALVLGAAATLWFMRTPHVLFFYLAGTGGLLLFSHVVYRGVVRHHGHLFLVLIACLWLAAWHQGTALQSASVPSWKRVSRRVAGTVVLGILLVQVAVGGIFLAADLRRPFSPAADATAFIRDHGLADLPMVGTPAPAASSIAGGLDRPIHYVATGSAGTFVPWNRYVRGKDQAVSMNLLRPFLDEHAGHDVLVILGSAFTGWDEDLSVEELARFDRRLTRTESFVLYRARVRQDRGVSPAGST